MNNIIKYLTDNNKTISTMESATGGYLASSITNVEGSSLVFKFGAVTYSNEFKIKMGVGEETIQKYTVYSIETAMEMSKVISNFTNSNYGIGVTGKINSADPYNQTGDNSLIFLSLYDKENNCFYNSQIKAIKEKRIDNKELVLQELIKIFQEKIIK